MDVYGAELRWNSVPAFGNLFLDTNEYFHLWPYYIVQSIGGRRRSFGIIKALKPFHTIRDIGLSFY